MSASQVLAVVIALVAFFYVAAYWRKVILLLPPVWLVLGIWWYLEKKRAKRLPYQGRLTELTDSLKASADDVQLLIGELDQLVEQRSAALQKAEANLQLIEGQERSLAERIETLRDLNPEVAKVFVD